MKPPIFVLDRDGGDVMAFNTVELALTWPERRDVEKAGYVAWDADGVPLEVELRDKQVALEPAHVDAPPREEFETVLRRFLAAFGEPAPVAGCTIPELVALCDPWIVVSTDANGCSPVASVLSLLKRWRSSRQA